ncbi:hypothetical protein X777_11544 [Ooceraea biroi]|uniref:Uncharacterized protein n=1 Tax=Ooceraea biroi TaxID=2015173 RepID=A0A026W3E8_OOCBI|nr:hypothetical protein X777_11544 [Ooceraea biroi]
MPYAQSRTKVCFYARGAAFCQTGGWYPGILPVPPTETFAETKENRIRVPRYVPSPQNIRDYKPAPGDLLSDRFCSSRNIATMLLGKHEREFRKRWTPFQDAISRAIP